MRRSPLRRGSPPRRRTPLRPGRPPRRVKRLTRTTPPQASPAQRAKVAGRRCLVCGAVTRVDPAHLVSRSMGGCDAADCVVPLCRAHHRAYDQEGLDLVAFLEPHWRAEVAHAVCHLGLMRALRHLSGKRSVGEGDER